MSFNPGDLQTRLILRGEPLTIALPVLPLPPYGKNLLRSAHLFFGRRVKFPDPQDETGRGAVLTLSEEETAALRRMSAAFSLDEEGLEMLWQLGRAPLGALRRRWYGASQKERFFAFLEGVDRWSHSHRPGFSPEEEPRRLFRRWQGVYGALAEVPVREGVHALNSTNCGEVETYRALFDEAEAGVESIDNAIATLLDTLPADVEKIADVGAGPGYVNRHIPACYHVLAVDLDERILRDNLWPWCVGDILQLPLADRSVDMVLASDVLEHIEPEQLPAAIAELERVSGKYLYLQVPYCEYLGAAMARCGGCGHRWHVNYHKNSFDFRRLSGLAGPDWVVDTAAFTGELRDADGFRAAGLLLDEAEIPHSEVEGWTCPVCGGKSVAAGGEDLLAAANAIAEAEAGQPPAFPHYSELAVLFRRRELPPARFAGRSPAPGAPSAALTGDCFFRSLPRQKDFVPDQWTPYLNLQNTEAEETPEGLRLRPLDPGGTSVVSVFIPGAFSPQPHTLRLTGHLDAPGELIFCGLSIRGSEYQIAQRTFPAGRVVWEISVDSPDRSAHGYFKLYLPGGALLTELYDLDFPGRPYQVFQAGDAPAHLRREEDGVRWKWLAPAGAAVAFKGEPSDWRDSRLPEIPPRALTRFYRARMARAAEDAAEEQTPQTPAIPNDEQEETNHES